MNADNLAELVAIEKVSELKQMWHADDRRPAVALQATLLQQQRKKEALASLGVVRLIAGQAVSRIGD